MLIHNLSLRAAYFRAEAARLIDIIEDYAGKLPESHKEKLKEALTVALLTSYLKDRP